MSILSSVLIIVLSLMNIVQQRNSLKLCELFDEYHENNLKFLKEFANANVDELVVLQRNIQIHLDNGDFDICER